MSLNAAYGFLGRLASEPQLIAPQFTAVSAVVRQMIVSADVPNLQAKHLAETAAAWGADVPERKPYAFADGIAIIPVHGTLINRFNGAWGFVTGYDYIRGAFDAALADSAVQGIMLDVNSYGGEVHGCFELADHIHSMRGKKPVRAIVNANCYSAAYAVASCADSITVTPSGGAGSIGVVTMHVDLSKALEDQGVKVTFVYAGKHKVDGNPYQPLPDSVKANIQARIDNSYEKFVGAVSRNRGMSAQKVRDTEASIYAAEDAKKIGLIDSVAPPKAAFGQFTRELSGRDNQEFDEMSHENTPENAEVEEVVETAAAPAETPAEAPAEAPAEQPAAEAPAEQPAAAAPTERDRIRAILSCEEATSRPRLANHFALNTDLSVDDARAALAASAEEGKPSGKSPFEAAMDASTEPDVGSGNSTDEAEEDSPKSRASRIVADYKAATGRDLTK